MTDEEQDRRRSEQRRQFDRRYEDRRQNDISMSDHDLLLALRSDVAHIENSLVGLVTRMEFMPVKLITYALVGMVLSGVTAAILALVVRGRVN